MQSKFLKITYQSNEIAKASIGLYDYDFDIDHEIELLIITANAHNDNYYMQSVNGNELIPLNRYNNKNYKKRYK